MLDQRLERDPDGSYKNNGNSYDAFLAITCLDDQGGTTSAEALARAERWEKQAPTFGPALSWSEALCSNWPIPAKESKADLADSAAGPVLVVSSTHDPATPLPWAKQVAQELPRAKLVTWDADGHTAYLNGSSCLDKVVDDYLLSGSIPADQITCRDGGTL
jgi:pimeloyl-ACP methyl ester carboxylesterase